MIKKLLFLLLLLVFFVVVYVVMLFNMLVVVQGFDDIVSFDLVEVNEFFSIQMVFSFYQCLVQLDCNNFEKIVLIFVESWQVDLVVKILIIKLKLDVKFVFGNLLCLEDVIFFYICVVMLNKLLVFIFNVFGWQLDNIVSQLKKVDDYILMLYWIVDVSLVVVLNIFFIFIVFIVDEKQVVLNVKNNDFGNDWLKMYLVGSGVYKMCVYQLYQVIVLEVNVSFLIGVLKIKSIIIKNVFDLVFCCLLIQQGDVDVVCDFGVDQIVVLQDKFGVKVLSILFVEQNYLVFNIVNSVNLLFNNLVFWEVVCWLVDYEGIIKNLLKGQYFIY